MNWVGHRFSLDIRSSPSVSVEVSLKFHYDRPLAEDAVAKWVRFENGEQRNSSYKGRLEMTILFRAYKSVRTWFILLALSLVKVGFFLDDITVPFIPSLA